MTTTKNGSLGETPAELITRTMAQQGFAPSNVYSAHYIEFVKTYADADGRVARAVVQFERPNGIIGTGVRLCGFNVLVQAHVEATVEAVEERAPPVMRDDLFAIVNAFDSGPPAPTIAFERCGRCRMPVAEFFVVAGSVLCRACKEG